MRERHYHRVTWGVALATGLLLVGAAISAALGVGRTTVVPSTRGGILRAQFEIPGGVEVTLLRAQSDSQYPVLVPTDPLASTQDLSQVWENAQTQQVELVFANGDLNIAMRPSTYKDPQAELSSQVSLGISQASMTSVNGTPALVIQPNTDYYRSNPAWVRMIIGGVDVNIFSTKYGTDQLLSVAASLPTQ